MGLDLTKKLKPLFELASLRRDAKHLLTSQNWQTYQQIKLQHDAYRQVERQSYIQEYDTRVEVAMKRLIAQAGAKTKAHKPRWAVHDRFDKKAIITQAHRNVQSQQTQVLAGIDAMEAKALSKLLKQAKGHSEAANKPEDDRFETPVKQTPNRLIRPTRPHRRNH